MPSPRHLDCGSDADGAGVLAAVPDVTASDGAKLAACRCATGLVGGEWRVSS